MNNFLFDNNGTEYQEMTGGLENENPDMWNSAMEQVSSFPDARDGANCESFFLQTPFSNKDNVPEMQSLCSRIGQLQMEPSSRRRKETKCKLYCRADAHKALRRHDILPSPSHRLSPYNPGKRGQKLAGTALLKRLQAKQIDKRGHT